MRSALIFEAELKVLLRRYKLPPLRCSSDLKAYLEWLPEAARQDAALTWAEDCIDDCKDMLEAIGIRYGVACQWDEPKAQARFLVAERALGTIRADNVTDMLDTIEFGLQAHRFTDSQVNLISKLHNVCLGDLRHWCLQSIDRSTLMAVRFNMYE